jgi:AcrR family transcriptional regulator
MVLQRHDQVRKPKQARSQQRVDQILDATRSLIAERGSAGLTITEIAEVASISAASMYQYFPNKSAILAVLAERYLAEIGALITNVLDPPPESFAEAADRIVAIVELGYQMNLQDPVMRDIIQGLVTDKSLWEINVRDTRQKVDQICAAIEPVVPDGQKGDLRITIHLLTEFAEAAVRAALDMPALQARRTVDRLKEMLRAIWFSGT